MPRKKRGINFSEVPKNIIKEEKDDDVIFHNPILMMEMGSTRPSEYANDLSNLEPHEVLMLQRMGAIGNKRELRETGTKMIDLDMSTRSARIVVEAQHMEQKEGRDGIVPVAHAIAAYRDSVVGHSNEPGSSIFAWPGYAKYNDLTNPKHVEERRKTRYTAKLARQELYKGNSDLELMLHIIAAFLQETHTPGKGPDDLKSWYEHFFLHPKGMQKFIALYEKYRANLDIEQNEHNLISQLQNANPHDIARLLVASHIEHLLLLKTDAKTSNVHPDEQHRSDAKRRRSHAHPTYVFPGVFDTSAFGGDKKKTEHQIRTQVMLSPFSVVDQKKDRFGLGLALTFHPGQGTRAGIAMKRIYAGTAHRVSFDDLDKLKTRYDEKYLRTRGYDIEYIPETDSWVSRGTIIINTEIVAAGNLPVDTGKAAAQFASMLNNYYLLDGIDKYAPNLKNTFAKNKSTWKKEKNIYNRSGGEIAEPPHPERWYAQKLQSLGDIHTIQALIPHADALKYNPQSIPRSLELELDKDLPNEISIGEKTVSVEYTYDPEAKKIVAKIKDLTKKNFISIEIKQLPWSQTLESGRKPTIVEIHPTDVWMVGPVIYAPDDMSSFNLENEKKRITEDT